MRHSGETRRAYDDGTARQQQLLLTLGLAFAPPSHKTGNAAVGLLLCVMAGVVAAFTIALVVGDVLMAIGFLSYIVGRSH